MIRPRRTTTRATARVARLRTASFAGLVSACVAACGVTRPPVAVAPWPTAAGTVDVYAVGDIADCADVEPAESAAARTGKLVPPGSLVLGLGDMAYPLATESQLAGCYEPTWGIHRDRTFAVAGNHDYVRGDTAAFRAYVRVPAVDPGFVAYSVELAPGWRFIALDSNVGADALQRELDWLGNALDDTMHDRCVIAAWHAPLFSSGLHRGSGAAMRPFWQLLDEHGADLVLNGHEHFYEAFEPRDAGGQVEPEGKGPREFTVGTGGGRLYGFWRPPYASRARVLDHGVLRLALEPGRYTWAFIDVDGHIRAAGAAPCRVKEGAAPASTG
jgi:hypothetical protein